MTSPAIFAAYNKGSFTMDDSQLAEQGIHRLGNVLVPVDSYGPLIEEKMQSFLKKEYEGGTRRMTTADICRMIGENTGESSFLHWASKTGTKVIVPGIVDGAVGSQVWMFTQSHPDFMLDVVGDAQTLSSSVFGAKKSGALMIGGGISKHHTLWWNQYRDGLDYALYITTASEFDGSLSGAQVREAISWGKGNRQSPPSHSACGGYHNTALPVCGADLAAVQYLHLAAALGVVRVYALQYNLAYFRIHV